MAALGGSDNPEMMDVDSVVAAVDPAVAEVGSVVAEVGSVCDHEKRLVEALPLCAIMNSSLYRLFFCVREKN